MELVETEKDQSDIGLVMKYEENASALIRRLFCRDTAHAPIGLACS